MAGANWQNPAHPGFIMKTARLLLLCTLTIWATATQAQDPLVRNGDWWQKLPGQEVKWGFLVGLFDGLTLGHRLSWWPLEQDEKHSDCTSPVIEAFRTQVRTYLASLDNRILANELDTFYREPDHRSIRISDAVWIIAKKRAGAPKTEIDSMIQHYRSR
jgi:hypothetical protein